MKVEYYAPLWGSEHLSYTEFFSKVIDAGYDGIEAVIPVEEKALADFQSALSKSGLKIIGHVGGTLPGSDIDESLENYERWIRHTLDVNPEFVNAQSGRDFYTYEQNRKFIDLANLISQDNQIRIVHETHRAKFSFAAHVTQQYLVADPDLRITADFSHWCCVAESLLEDQPHAVEIAISRADHIHARVGCGENAQVSDIKQGLYKRELDAHLAWWDKIVVARIADDSERLTITCEFGPEPYIPLVPDTKKPLTDPWQLNLDMLSLLRERYKLYSA